MRFNTILFFLFLSALFVSASPKENLTAQLRQVTNIEGTVTDRSSEVIRGATVTATNLEGRSFSATTDDLGKFSIRDIPTGRYKVQVQANGFKSFTVDDVVVEVGRTATLNILLPPSDIEVTVSIVSKIKGVVKNNSGQPIQDAEITFKRLSNDEDYDPVKTDTQGKYEKPGLEPDKYKVRAEASGFRPSEKTIRLGASTVKKVDFKLRPQ
jgi:hypothetical protein